MFCYQLAGEEDNEELLALRAELKTFKLQLKGTTQELNEEQRKNNVFHVFLYFIAFFFDQSVAHHYRHSLFFFLKNHVLGINGFLSIYWVRFLQKYRLLRTVKDFVIDVLQQSLRNPYNKRTSINFFCLKSCLNQCKMHLFFLTRIVTTFFGLIW